jgi:PAS domain S-box-containing protein
MAELSTVHKQPDFQALFESAPDAYLVLTPSMHVVAVSDAYLKVTMTRRDEILGQHLFEIFPDNPDDSKATGVSNLRASLDLVLQHRTSDAMAVQKYDIRRPQSEGGGFEERYWSPVNAPVLGTDGAVAYIIHRVEDVTEFVHLKQARSKQDRVTEALQSHADEMKAEIVRWEQQNQEINGQLQIELDDRKRAEEERDRFFTLSLDMLCIAKADGYFRRVSPAFTQTLGWSVEELLARPFFDFVHPDDRAATLHEVERQVATGEQVLEFENRYRHKDGSWRTLSWKSVPHPDGTMYATARDVTAQRKAKEALQRLAAIIESSDDAIIGKTVDGIVTSWNKGAARLYGYTLEEVVGKPIAILLPPDRLDEEAQILARLKRGERIEHFETIRKTKGGQLVDVSLTISLVRDKRGAIIGISKIARDITERKWAHDKLQESEARLAEFKCVLDQTLDCIFMFRPDDLRFVYANEGAMSQVGYTMAELLQMTPVDLKPEFTVKRFLEMVQPLLDGTQRSLTLETLHRHKDGHGIPVEIFIQLVPLAGGESRFVAVVRDITERKQAEETLRRAHDELERRVQERTVDLRQKNRDLETLLYVTSHDLREPLRSIENFSRLVQDRYAERLDDKGKDFLRRVVRGAQRMDQLMTDLLALSRIQRMELPTEDIDGKSLVQDALQQLDGRIKETGARVRVAQNLPRLLVNRTWATQGISNLIANALKFKCDGEAPDIEIAPFRPNGNESGEVGVIVRDRGPGVAPEHAERIFQLFQRAVGREVEGTGAGLAIVRQIAERHGGRAWVQPREGGGSEFILTFSAGQASKRT